MFTKSIFFAAVLLALSSVSIAFPSGAGRCVIGEPSPTAAHGSSLAGSIADGEYAISVEGATMDEETGIITAEVGVEFNLTIAGPDYKGVLLMVADQPDTAITIPGEDLQLAFGGGCPGTASVTHTSRDSKESSSTFVLIEEAVNTTLEVNVVQSLTTYFYSQYELNVV